MAISTILLDIMFVVYVIAGIGLVAAEIMRKRGINK